VRVSNLILSTVIFLYSYSYSQSSNGLNPFSNIGSNSLKSITGNNLFFHGAGILSTYILINSGIDYRVHNFFAGNGCNSFFDPAVGAGYIMPAVLGGGLYFYGNFKNDEKIKTAGSAVIQAALISLAFSTVLKAFTGRPGPDPGTYNDNGDASEIFRFGFLRGGIHYGWPSGHLCTNTAIITCLTSFYNKSTSLKIAGLLYTGYIFYGVTAHDNNTMHWFSDVVSGFLMGYAIGSTVGSNFRKAWEEDKVSGAESDRETKIDFLNLSIENGSCIYNFSPVIISGYQGINLNISFNGNK
jgi:hypothetical protein